LIFKSKGRSIEVTYPKKKSSRRFISSGTPLDEIKGIMSDFRAVGFEGLPRFYGGLVGYIGYEMVKFFEELPDNGKDELGLPDSVLMLADTILVFDHINHTIKIVSNAILPVNGRRVSKEEKVKIYGEAIKKIESISDKLKKAIPGNEKEKATYPLKYKITSNFKRSAFSRIVKTAKDYITRGDIIQVVLSQRFKVGIGKGDPLAIYRNLRSLNPSPYMFYLKLKDFFIVGSSPEMLVRCEDGLVQTRPIAGTRRRGKDDREDQCLAKELINDKKERAEHLMLVDLGRNDLGRVSRPGTVKVNSFMAVEKYSHVMHLVSEVKGILDSGKYDIYDVLRACFPAGTVSGSPKIRAMEIIDELENLKRGPYAGCVGYFSFSHNMDTCITIRTIVICGQQAYIQAGAGIVADSVPDKEYLESVNKAKALIEAIIKTGS
jgi:anthranilate synthase component 1